MVVQQLTPGAVAQFNRLRRRGDDVRKKDGGKDSVTLASLRPGLADEPADLAKQLVAPCEGDMVGTGELDIVRIRNLLDHPAGSLHAVLFVVASVDDERRHG